jgi:hypothetical protein
VLLDAEVSGENSANLISLLWRDINSASLNHHQIVNTIHRIIGKPDAWNLEQFKAVMDDVVSYARSRAENIFVSLPF